MAGRSLILRMFRRSKKNKKGLWDLIPKALNSLAEGPGFEPGFTESESVVLPLNDPPNILISINIK